MDTIKEPFCSKEINYKSLIALIKIFIEYDITKLKEEKFQTEKFEYFMEQLKRILKFHTLISEDGKYKELYNRILECNLVYKQYLEKLLEIKSFIDEDNEQQLKKIIKKFNIIKEQ